MEENLRVFCLTRLPLKTDRVPNPTFIPVLSTDDNAASGRRFDVLVYMKKIVRIVIGLDLSESFIIFAVSGTNPVPPLFHHEVDI